MTNPKDLWGVFEMPPQLNTVKIIEEAFEEYITKKSLPFTHFWRVKILDSESVEVKDYTMPKEDDRITKVFKRNGLPKWIANTLAVLEICEDGTVIENIGKKLNDNVFYIEDKKYVIR